MVLTVHGVKNVQVTYNSSKHAKDAYEKLLSTINARYILTSYSTDGNIEPKDLLMANLERGKVTLLTQDVPRYRVSKQRPVRACTCA